MEGVKMNFMIPVPARLVKSLLAAHQPANTSLQLATTPVIVMQDVPDNTINLIQISSSDVNLNLPVGNVKQPCSSLRSVRNVHPPKTLESSQNNCDEEESSSDIEEIEVLPSKKYIQPSTTKILSSGKNATVQKIIESLPKAPEVITIDEPNQFVHKKEGKPAKKLKETRFKCDICDEEFRKRYLYQRHMHEHSLEKPHHCPKCSASFNVPTNFTLHMATHNIGEPKCPMCNKRFARMASLKAHMVMHEKDENLYCPECDGVFETKSQLESHMKLHDTDKWPSEDYRKCKLCRAKFTHPALYRQHLRDHYKVQTKIERLTKRGVVRQGIINSCRICKKSFEKPSQLARHLRVHTGEKPYRCNLCNRGFTQKGSLKIHMWQHEGNRPHSCAFCPAKFSQKGNLKTHIQKTHKVQKGSPVYRCTNCTCIFRTLGSLNNHINRVHSSDRLQNKGAAEKSEERQEEAEESDAAEDNDDEIRFEMDHENRPRNRNSARSSRMDDNVGGEEKVEGDGDTDLQEGFVVMDNEETAMVTVLDKASSEVEKKYVKIKQRYVNNSKVYVCSYCDKDFKKPSDLMRHLRVHTMEKPFKCKVCKRGFTLKATLLVHERVHKTEERFRCQICSVTWRSEKELNDHEKIHSEHYKCGICEKQLPNFKALKTHTMTEHARKKPKKQVSEEARNIAKKVQLKDPLELKVASNGLLLAEPKHRNDLVNGRGRPHKCPSCPAAFMKLSHLKQHHRKHTGERPFECYLCNKKFTTISALNSHARTHDCTKPFKCPVCSVDFTTNSSMKRHLVTHTNKRPYMCPYCNKTFKTTVNCRKHIKIHKMEIAEEELAKQTRGEVSTPADEATVITLKDGVTTIQPILIPSEPLLQPTEAEINQPFVSILPATQNVLTIGQNLTIVNNPKIGTAQKHLANETGTVTLVSYPSGQPFTPDNIKALEDSLNQQLRSINMNLQNQAASIAQNPPVLSVIYNDGKTYETQINSSANSNSFAQQVNNFDINQMTLQTLKNEIEMEINPATSTSMTNILPDTLQVDSNLTQPVPIQFDLTSLKNEISSSDQATNVALTKGNQSPENQVVDDINLQCHMCKKRDFTTETLKEHLKTHQGTREYECTYCLSKFCSSGGLSRHMKIHETPEKHKCYDCKQEFTTSRELTVHIKEHVKQEMEQKNAIGINETIDVGLKDENDKKNNECAYCSKIFRKPSDLIRHIRTHTGERPYQCPHCDKSFAVKCTLDSHVKAHDGVKEFHCYVCNNVFATKGSLKVHMRLHTGDKPFKCDMCDAKFRTSGHRKVHMVSHARQNARKSPNQNQNLSSPNSTAETSNECSPAQMTMNSEFVPSQPNDQIVTNNQNQYENLTIDHTLNTITLNSVNDQITFNADGTILNDSAGLLNLNDNNQLVANLQYFLSNGMVSVQVGNPTISPQLPIPAVDINPSDFEQIDASDAQKPMSDSQMVFAPQTLNPNLGIMNVGNFDLQSCTVLHMDDAGSLSDPVKEKVRNKQPKTPNPMPRRECDICGKAFAKPCQVERHKRVHTGERPYKCDLCTKSFAQKSTLQVHKKHHSGDRPHPCPQCERSFSQSGNLHTHLKRVHKLDPADIKRLTKPQNANCDAKLSVDDIFIDFSLADLLR